MMTYCRFYSPNTTLPINHKTSSDSRLIEYTNSEKKSLLINECDLSTSQPDYKEIMLNLGDEIGSELFLAPAGNFIYVLLKGILTEKDPDDTQNILLHRAGKFTITPDFGFFLGRSSSTPGTISRVTSIRVCDTGVGCLFAVATTNELTAIAIPYHQLNGAINERNNGVVPPLNLGQGKTFQHWKWYCSELTPSNALVELLDQFHCEDIVDTEGTSQLAIAERMQPKI